MWSKRVAVALPQIAPRLVIEAPDDFDVDIQSFAAASQDTYTGTERTIAGAEALLTLCEQPRPPRRL